MIKRVLNKCRRSLRIIAAGIGLMVSMLVAPPASAQTATDLRQFAGHWSGVFPESSVVDLQIFYGDGALNVTAKFNSLTSNLQYLGFKSSFSGVYFWRQGDRAPMSLFFENGVLIMAYFEKDTVRRVPLYPVR